MNIWSEKDSRGHPLIHQKLKLALLKYNGNIVSVTMGGGGWAAKHSWVANGHFKCVTTLEKDKFPRKQKCAFFFLRLNIVATFFAVVQNENLVNCEYNR